MNTKELFSHKDEFINYLKNSGRCEKVIRYNENILNKFEIFCLSNMFFNFEEKEVKLFLVNKLSFNCILYKWKAWINTI